MPQKRKPIPRTRKTFSAAIAREYYALRICLGTQAEAARLLGVDRVTVARRERALQVVTPEAMWALRFLCSHQGRRIAEADACARETRPQ